MNTRVLVAVAAAAVIILIAGSVVVLQGTSTAPSSSSSPSASTAKTADSTCPFTPGKTTAGNLVKTDDKTGDGAEAQASSTVTVKYTGCLADGTVFDSTAKQGGQPASFPLSGVIKGWQDGIPGMKVGGIRTLVIPPDLAYGDQASGAIPAGSTLTFQVELVDVK